MRYTTHIVIASAMAVFGFGAPSVADENVDDLLEAARALQQRVNALEGEIERIKRANSDSATAARIEQLEDSRASSRADDFRVYWQEGLRFDTHDKRFKIRLRGRLQQDWAWFDQSESLEFVWDPIAQAGIFAEVDDGTEMRRAWFELYGDLDSDVRFAMQFDFAQGDIDLYDLFIEWRNVPYAGNVRIGHFREPLGMEQLTSSKYVTFMERALPNALVPGWNSGVMLYNTLANGRVTWAAGLFKDVDTYGRGEEDGQSALTARFTALPLYQDAGRRLIHVGAAYSVRNVDGTVRFQARPESRIAPHFIDTGNVYAGTYDLIGLESAAVWGPFSVQAEYIRAQDIDASLSSRRDYDGYYVQTSYFLTGEHRSYNLECAVWDQIIPNRPFSVKRGATRGWGAWELGLRYSSLDLDGGYAFPGGGTEDNWTVGLNWYLNANTRVTFNYVNADVHHPLYQGELEAFQTRFQLAF